MSNGAINEVELGRLVSRAADGAITAEELARLEGLLLLKRARYLRDLGVEAKLEELARSRVQPAWEAARLEPANERRRKLGERLTVSDELAQGLIQRFGLK